MRLTLNYSVCTVISAYTHLCNTFTHSLTTNYPKNEIKSPNNLKHQTTLPKHYYVRNLLTLDFHKLNHHHGKD